MIEVGPAMATPMLRTNDKLFAALTFVCAVSVLIMLGAVFAIYLTEKCPLALRRPIGIAIEFLAGIPSIIFGIWGLFCVCTISATHGSTSAD
jgi:phosphate transport system permease protein